MQSLISTLQKTAESMDDSIQNGLVIIDEFQSSDAIAATIFLVVLKISSRR